MRWLYLLVTLPLTACAGTARVCPSGSQLAADDRASGRVEWCARTTGGFEAMPATTRAYPGLIAMAHPEPMSGTLSGPFTHWYPDGGVESHGEYVEDGATSVPDGVWGFWYPGGARKSVGRYSRGKPVGCFAAWDARGNEITGIANGELVREEPCAPPLGALADVERRSHPRGKRGVWGDVAIHAAAQAGTFGASNATQRDADPAARATAQGVLRAQVGRFRVGGALGLRISDTDAARAYSAAAVAAYALPLPEGRFGAEVEAQLGVQYLDITARRPDRVGEGSATFWAPLGGARLALSFAVGPTLQIVAGIRVDGAPTRDAAREVQYCGPICGAPMAETWKLGGVSYGLDLGLRLMLR